MFFTKYILSHQGLLCYNKTQGVEVMFKRMTTSLTRPPLAVFFMKDTWGKAILYLFMIPLWITIPTLINLSINPGMNVSRYESMISAISQDLMIEDAVIEAGILSYETAAKTTFEYFAIYLGEQTLARETLNFVLSENRITLQASGIEIGYRTYESLGLLDFDFSNKEEANVRVLASVIKQMYDEQRNIHAMDFFLAYFLGLFDYVMIVLFMSFLMMVFTSSVQLPYMYRLKLSIYLSTIYIVSYLIFMLFKLPGLDFISIGLVSFYHIWAYRSMKVIPNGGMV